MPRWPNESPDSHRRGQVEQQHWERLVIPCAHFVNYNSDEMLSGEPDQPVMMAMNIEETMAILTRCSFDETHRQPIFTLGGIPALAELIQVRSCHEQKSRQCLPLIEIHRQSFGIL